MAAFPKILEKNMFRVLVLLLLAFIISGCGALNKQLTGSVEYILDERTLQETDFEGRLVLPDVEVAYPPGLKTQAACVAERVNSIFEIVEDGLGLEVPFKIKIYLMRRDHLPQKIKIRPKDTYTLVFPLFVVYDKEDGETILSENSFLYPYTLAHELVETALIFRKESSVLPEFALSGFIRIRNYTRWFRDGLAGYAEYIVYRKIRSRDEDDPPQYPLSSLSKLKSRLFSWHQFHSDKGGDYYKYDEDDYYNASLGLFLLIEDRFGETSIRKILSRLGTKGKLNRKALIEIINETLETDIKKIVKDFWWPEIGVNTKYLTPALAKNRNLSVMKGLFVISVEKDGIAGKAGFQEGDVVIDVDGQPIESNLDFEIALLRSIREKKARITVDRLGMQEVLTLELVRKQVER